MGYVELDSHHPKNMLTTSTHTDIKEFKQLENHWNTLFVSNPNATLFNSFEWIENWIHHYWISNYSLKITIVYDNEDATALLPLYLNRRDNRIRFLGSGEPECCEVASEYLDFLLNMNYTEQHSIHRFIADFLQSNYSAPIELVNCLGSSHAFQISENCRNSIRVPSGKRYQINLNDQFEGISSCFSKNYKKKSNQILNRFDKSESLKFEKLLTENYEAHWLTLKKLHTEDWVSRGKPGAFADEKFNSFHNRMHKFYPQIEQVFYILSDNNEAISINLYYKFNNTFYFYATGSNKSYGALSPGLLLHSLCIRSLAGEQFLYDFMKGALKKSYKQKFCKSDGVFNSITIFNCKSSGRVRHLLSQLKSCYSKLKYRVKTGSKAV